MEVEVTRLKELLDSGAAQLIDVRVNEEHEAGRIPGARHIDLADVQSAAGTIDRDRPVVFYCRSGDRSAMAAEAFEAGGYEAYNLAGGIVAWKEQGLPLDPENGEIVQRGPGS